MAKKIKNTDFNKHIIELFNILSDSIRKNGYDKIKKELMRVTASCKDPFLKSLELNIVKYSAEEYNVSVDDILNSYKRGDVADAKRQCYYFFNKYLPMSEYKIAIYFKRSTSQINATLNMFKNLNDEHSVDRNIKIKNTNIENKIKLLIKNNK